MLNPNLAQKIKDLRAALHALDYVREQIEMQSTSLNVCHHIEFCDTCCEAHKKELNIWEEQERIILTRIQNMVM